MTKCGRAKLSRRARQSLCKFNTRRGNVKGLWRRGDQRERRFSAPQRIAVEFRRCVSDRLSLVQLPVAMQRNVHAGLESGAGPLAKGTAQRLHRKIVGQQ